MNEALGSVKASRQGGQVSVADLDIVYKETDRLYGVLAQRCGLSDCAYWIMYAVEYGGGYTTQREIAEDYSYSKQTINSAVQALKAKGFIELVEAPRDKRTKLITFTKAGKAFSKSNIEPGMKAEVRAFETLERDEQAELVRLATKYSLAVEVEVNKLSELVENK